MAHNPLLGSRISLISKKNIRYEGTLYSINETDATVALQNVRAFGTEGREKLDTTGSCTFVPPQDAVHPYLLFRGCDIKDLHVHESAPSAAPPTDPAILSSTAPPDVKPPTNDSVARSEKPKNDEGEYQNDDKAPAKKQEGDTAGNSSSSHKHGEPSNGTVSTEQKKSSKGKQSGSRRAPKSNSKQMVGSGASLLNRKARGGVEGVEGPDKAIMQDFDFESKLAEFDKVSINESRSESEEDDDGSAEATNNPGGSSVYQKDDFFDSISCDVLDKQNGIDNRLRGAEERNLNTETFGAVSLGNGRRGGRRNRRGYGGRGRGGRGGRGGSGRFPSGDAPRPRENNRWARDSGGGRSGSGGRRKYGDGGLSTGRTNWAGGEQ